jgi:hypothetical protein
VDDLDVLNVRDTLLSSLDYQVHETPSTTSLMDSRNVHTDHQNKCSIPFPILYPGGNQSRSISEPSSETNCISKFPNSQIPNTKFKC